MRFGLSTAPQNCTWERGAGHLEGGRRDGRVRVGVDVRPLLPDLLRPDRARASRAGSRSPRWPRPPRRLRAGVMVTGMVYRHPAVLANMAATARHPERRAARARPRRGMERGGVRRLRHRARHAHRALRPLRGGPGGHPRPAHPDHDHVPRSLLLDVTDARCEPKSVQEPHPPIVIGGTGERRTIPSSRSGPTTGTPPARPPSTSSATSSACCDECCAEIGRDPSRDHGVGRPVRPRARRGSPRRRPSSPRPAPTWPSCDRSASTSACSRPLAAALEPLLGVTPRPGSAGRISASRAEVLEVAARRRAPLALVLRAGDRRAVRVVGRRRHRRGTTPARSSCPGRA